MIVSSKLENEDANSEQPKLISSLDYDANNDLVAACGNFKGIYLNKVENIEL